MSGHSKWATIKRQKGATDQKRGVLFSKLTRAIQLAVKNGGADLEANLKLKLAISKAKQANVPKDNISRAISSVIDKNIGDFKEVVYEAFGPQGIALIIKAVTDNLNRTVAEIKHLLNKGGGKLVEKNSAHALFAEVRTIIVSGGAGDQEKLTLTLMDLGAEDITEGSHQKLIALFDKEHFSSAMKSLSELKIDYLAKQVLKPIAPITLTEPDKNKLLKLIEDLENLDDVETVYSNAVY